MEGAAGIIRELAHGLCPHEPLEQGGGVLRRMFEALQTEGVIQIRVESVCLDGATVKVHPNGTGALKKRGSRASGGHAADSPQKFMWSPRLTVRL